MSKITEKDINFLRNKLKNLVKEFESYKEELKLLKPKTTRETISERFYKSRKTEQIFELNESKVHKVDNKKRLSIYELLSGIIVHEISLKYYPIIDKNGQIVETTYNKFEVEASINQLKFHISYVSNQNLEDCYEDKVQTYDVKELDIFMMKKVHQNELKPAIDYYQKNPSQFRLAMLCLKDYEELYNIRAQIKKEIMEKNPDFVQCALLVDDNDRVYLETVVGTDKTKYFTLDWSIVWAENLRTVIDQFEVEIHFEDEDFLESVNHNFEKLTNIKLMDILVSDPNDENIRKEKDFSYVLPPQEKLNLIKNAILAAKASE